MTQGGDSDPRIGRLIKEAQAAIHTRMAELLRPYDLSPAQYAALELISGSPNASNAHLARGAFVSRQSMNTMLKTLEGRGLVERASAPTAGRELPVSLTPDGTALLTRARGAVVQLESETTSRLSPDAHTQLTVALHSVIAALKQTHQH